MGQLFPAIHTSHEVDVKHFRVYLFFVQKLLAMN